MHGFWPLSLLFYSCARVGWRRSQITLGGSRRRSFGGQRKGWKSPGDVAALLMILNGDMSRKQLAQMSGSRLVPVAFSFGWVVYSIQALSTAIGTGRLMPAGPDWDSIVVNVRSGHARANRSWILGRLLRDWKYEPELGESLCITVLDAVNQADLDRDTEQVSMELTDPRSIEPGQRVGSTEADQDPERGPSAGIHYVFTQERIKQP